MAVLGPFPQFKEFTMYLRLAVFILLVAASFWAAEYNRKFAQAEHAKSCMTCKLIAQGIDSPIDPERCDCSTSN